MTAPTTTRGTGSGLTYWAPRRTFDYFHGVVDSRTHQASPITALPWVRRLQATFQQGCQTRLRQTHQHLAPELTRLEELARDLTALDTRINDATSDLSGPKAAPRAPTPAEEHYGERISVRINAEAARTMAGLTARRDALVAERSQLEKDAAGPTAVVAKAFDDVVLHCHEHHAHTHRRLHTYARRLALRRSDLTTLSDATTMPDWASDPCPWIPGRLRTPDRTPPPDPPAHGQQPAHVMSPASRSTQ
jgi:hypothetical protein